MVRCAGCGDIWTTRFGCYCERQEKRMIPILQVGKTYVDIVGRKIEIVAQTEGVYIGAVAPDRSKGYLKARYESYLVDGTAIEGYGHCPSIFKEYKEPVIHKREVVWFARGQGFPCAVLVDVGAKVSHFFGIDFREVKRQTVEYVE